MKNIVLICALFTASLGFSQVDYSELITSGEHNSYVKAAVRERPVIAYPYLREADVKFSRRVIRCIDVRQKMNKQLEWPRNPLNKFFYEKLAIGYENGGIRAYRNDSLQSIYTAEDFVMRGGTERSIFRQTNPDDPEEGYDSIIVIPYKWNDIKKYYVLEDWIFDYKYSVFKPRILAIAPIFSPTVGGQAIGEQALCWMKMDEIRPLLVNLEMFNRYNDAARLSYDDFFQMRIFDSYIVYESNMYDNYLNQYQEFSEDTYATLLKGEEIKNDLFIFEHDLWQY